MHRLWKNTLRYIVSIIQPQKSKTYTHTVTLMIVQNEDLNLHLK